MTLPGAGDFDLFAFRDREKRADDGCARTAVLIQTRHGVVRLRMLIGDPADRALNRGRLVLFFRQRNLRHFILRESVEGVNGAPLPFTRRQLKFQSNCQCPDPLPSIGSLSPNTLLNVQNIPAVFAASLASEN